CSTVPCSGLVGIATPRTATRISSTSSQGWSTTTRSRRPRLRSPPTRSRWYHRPTAVAATGAVAGAEYRSPSRLRVTPRTPTLPPAPPTDRWQPDSAYWPRVTSRRTGGPPESGVNVTSARLTDGGQTHARLTSVPVRRTSRSRIGSVTPARTASPTTAVPAAASTVNGTYTNCPLGMDDSTAVPRPPSIRPPTMGSP